jgi:hemerythrin
MWDAKYSVGIKSIDSQHQKFFEIINEIYFLVGNHHQEPDKDSLLKVIGNLAEYADTHLKYEEKYFEEFKYGGAEEHTQAHDLMREKIKSYVELVKIPETDVTKVANEMADFLKDWLSAHILDMDHKYIQLFLTHDVR